MADVGIVFCGYELLFFERDRFIDVLCALKNLFLTFLHARSTLETVEEIIETPVLLNDDYDVLIGELPDIDCGKTVGDCNDELGLLQPVMITPLAASAQVRA